MARTVCISFVFSLLLSSLMRPAENKNNIKTPLIIFHIDLNSVALKEDYLRKWLLKAADMGYNAVLWEVEDKVKWETCPECVSPDAFSKKTFKEIVKYSKSLGLEPIPLLQTVGHAEYVLRHKKYISFKEDPLKYDCYATGKPELRKFIKSWIKEYLDLFGGIRYFHLGGDEAYEFATNPSSYAEVRKYGKGKLYADYMSDVARPLLKKGIRPCIWNDMIMKYPEAISSIPESFVIWDWNYWDGDATPQKVMVWDKGKKLSKEELTPDDIRNFPEIIDKSGNLRAFYTAETLKRLGYDVVLCSSSRSSGDGVFAVRQAIHASNIIGAAKKTVEDNLLGTCVTSWAVRIPRYETQQTLFCLAPLTIKYSTLTQTELQSKSFEFTFGSSNKKIMEAFDNISFPFPFADGQSTGIMWTGMKDSRPAPPGYIKNMITKWKSEDLGKQWVENVALIKESTIKISEGIRKLNEFLPKAAKGLDVLEAWEKAGYFQYRGSVIANYIVTGDRRGMIPDGLSEWNSRTDSSFQATPAKNKKDAAQLLIQLKSNYKQWADSWMTPNSSESNSGLIYDALINYFKTNDN